MKSLAKKILALILSVTAMISICCPFAEASYVEDARFDTVGSILDAGHMYLVCDDRTKVRSRPCEDGSVIMTLNENTLVYSEKIVINRAGNRWIRTADGYIWEDHLKSHSHNWLDLSIAGCSHSICPECGSVISTDLLTSSVPLSEMTHLFLDFASLIPVANVGDAADIANAFIYLCEEEYEEAILQLISALPVAIAYGIDGLQVSKALKKIELVDDVHDTTIVLERFSDNADNVFIYEKGNSTKLAKSMDQRYDVNGLSRYDKNITISNGKRTVAAHHIIPAEMKEAAASRNILNYLDIGINTAENGVYLCMDSSNCVEGAVHVGTHSIEYIETVNRRITNAFQSVSGYEKQRIAVLNELGDIANELRAGKISLR